MIWRRCWRQSPSCGPTACYRHRDAAGPYTRGIAAAKRIRAEYPGTGVVVLWSLAAGQPVERAGAVGGDAIETGCPGSAGGTAEGEQRGDGLVEVAGRQLAAMEQVVGPGAVEAVDRELTGTAL